jgi:hypothetical protein
MQWLASACGAQFFSSGLAFYATALLSPTGWQTNLVSTAPLVFFLIAHLRVNRASAARIPAALAIALVAAADLVNYHTVGRLNFQRVLHYRHYGTAALLAVMLLGLSVWMVLLARPRQAGGIRQWAQGEVNRGATFHLSFSV